MNAIHTQLAAQGLQRPAQGRVLGGVCAGVARRLGWDPMLVRVLFVVACLVLPGPQVLLYPLLWLLMPAMNGPATSHTVDVPGVSTSSPGPQDRLR